MESNSSQFDASFDDVADTAESARRNWISVISVLGYVALCGLVYLLH